MRFFGMLFRVVRSAMADMKAFDLGEVEARGVCIGLAMQKPITLPEMPQLVCSHPIHVLLSTSLCTAPKTA